MNLGPAWKFALEAHPEGWCFPAESVWITGWIQGDEQHIVTDLRAWIDQRPFLGLHGLLQPEPDEPLLKHAGPHFAGFSFLLTPHPEAKVLRLEACDLEGKWTEFFRTTITVAPEAVTLPPPLSAIEMMPALMPKMLREVIRRPDLKLSEIADKISSSALAVPLHTSPNPPFVGALEEPVEFGRVRGGRVSVTGWLLHRSAKIKRLYAIIDPLLEIDLPPGEARHDVAKNFPELKDHRVSTFGGQIDLPSRINSPVLLKIYAELEAGEQHLVFAQRFKPEPILGSVPIAPIVSIWRFYRAAWALTKSARRLGMITHGAFAALRTAWAKYPSKKGARNNVSQKATNDTRPVRILAVTHNLNFEGAPRLLLELCQYIAQQPGISVQLISSQEGPLRALYEAAGILVTVQDLSSVFAAESTQEFHTQLAESGRQIDWSSIDLVLANTLVSFWAVHLAHQAGKPSLFYVHESAPIPRLFKSLVAPPLFPLIEKAIDQASRVAFTAHVSRQIYAKADRDNTRVLPSWLDVRSINEFATANDKTALRLEYGYDPDSVLVLNLGTVCERKGQHTFIQAAILLEAQLQQKYPDQKIELLMVGARDDAFLTEMKGHVAKAGLQRIHFVPETRENFAYHRMADVLVCTSFEESSPRVLLEAAAFGTPIVSTDVNGIPEMFSGKEVWLIEPGDRYHLAAAIRLALEAHFAGDTSRAKHASNTVSRRFDERISLPQHLALIREAAALQLK